MLVVPTIVALYSVSGATSLVTTECSAPESTMKIIGWSPTFISTVGSGDLVVRSLVLPSLTQFLLGQ
jgi:hypothetical protein